MSAPAGGSRAETRGGSILSMLVAMGPHSRLGDQLLLSHNLAPLYADGWYPLGTYVGVLREIERVAGRDLLFAIGRRVPEHVALPAEVDGLEEACVALDRAFRVGHRGAGAGGIDHEITGDDTAVVRSRTPYPCAFERGMIQGFLERLLPMPVAIEHDPAQCRENGADGCTHHVSVSPVSPPPAPSPPRE